MRSGRLNRNRKGNSLIEFALVVIFLVPLFFGTVSIGMNLGRSVQISQIVRDTGHLYVRNVDFSKPAGVAMVVRLAQGLNMTANGGEGVVILSKVRYIWDSQCLAGTGSTSCANKGRAVVVQRYVIGNASLRASDFATPDPGLILTAPDPAVGLKAGDIRSVDYCTNPSVIAQNFTTLLPGMAPGEDAYVVEAYFTAPDWALKQAMTQTVEGVYARQIY